MFFPEDIRVIPISRENAFWNRAKNFAKYCSWSAGPRLSRLMGDYEFKNWEKIFIAVYKENIIGFCSFTESDCIPIKKYAPYIGYLFVAEGVRGNKIGEKIVGASIDYAKSIGCNKVYIASNEAGFYEKLEFKCIDTLNDRWGKAEQIFVRAI